jgi:hypothetical protein
MLTDESRISAQQKLWAIVRQHCRAVNYGKNFQMKHILSFILFLSCSAPNKISWDNTKADNVRYIGSKAFQTKNRTHNL